jgi:hypothetical protein
MKARRVYKFDIALPVGAEVLHVGYDGQLRLWALVDPLTQNVIRHTLLVVGTGHDLPNEIGLTHLGTIQMPEDEGGFIWHVFKVAP